MSTRAAVLRCAVAGLLFVLCACGGKKGVSNEQKKELQECAAALMEAGNAHPADRLRILTTDCPFACPEAFPNYTNMLPGEGGTLVLSKCEVVCDGAGEQPGDKPFLEWLLDRCGLERYGLEPGQEPLASMDWLVIHRIGKWIADTRARLGSGDRELADLLAKRVTVPRLPVPVPDMVEGDYELPSSRQFGDFESRVFVFARADATTLGALPRAVFTEKGARMETGPGTQFPGSPVALAELRKRALELDRAVYALDKPISGPKPLVPIDEQPVAAPAPENREAPADKAAAGKSPPEAGGREKKLEMVKSTGILEALEEGGRAEEQDAAMIFEPQPRADAPLVLADRSLPVDRVVEVIRALGVTGARLAVSAVRGGIGTGVAAHRLLLAKSVARTPILLYLTDSSLVVWRAGAEAVEFRKGKDGFEWRPIEDKLRGLARASSAPLTVAADPSITVSAWVRLLDRVAAASYTQATVLSSADARALMGRENPGEVGNEDR